jgi:acyl carrier protein
MQSIEKIIRTYIEKSILFSPDGFEFTDETSFLDNGIVDSTSVLELVMFIEEQFGISVKDSEVIPENFDSVSSLTMYIKNKMKNN